MSKLEGNSQKFWLKLLANFGCEPVYAIVQFPIVSWAWHGAQHVIGIQKSLDG